jgi:hypothetical protein
MAFQIGAGIGKTIREGCRDASCESGFDLEAQSSNIYGHGMDPRGEPRTAYVIRFVFAHLILAASTANCQLLAAPHAPHKGARSRETQ